MDFDMSWIDDMSVQEKFDFNFTSFVDTKIERTLDIVEQSEKMAKDQFGSLIIENNKKIV